MCNRAFCAAIYSFCSICRRFPRRDVCYALIGKTGASRMTVILAGVAVSNLFSAAIDGIVTIVPEALTGITDFRIGGFTGVTMEAVKTGRTFNFGKPMYRVFPV